MTGPPRAVAPGFSGHFSTEPPGPGEGHLRQDQVSRLSDLKASLQLPERRPHAWGVSESLAAVLPLPKALGPFLHCPKGTTIQQHREGMKRKYWAIRLKQNGQEPLEGTHCFPPRLAHPLSLLLLHLFFYDGYNSHACAPLQPQPC